MVGCNGGVAVCVVMFRGTVCSWAGLLVVTQIAQMLPLYICLSIAAILDPIELFAVQDLD